MEDQEKSMDNLQTTCPHGNNPFECEECKAEQAKSMEVSSPEVSPEQSEIVERLDKAAAQAELEQLFGIAKTNDFWRVVHEGDIDTATRFVDHVEANLDRYPHYSSGWVDHRRLDIARVAMEQGGEKKLFVSKEAAVALTREKFGIGNTTEFRAVIESGQLDKAREWLQYVVENKEQFPHYQANWDSWLTDRRQEIAAAETE